MRRLHLAGQGANLIRVTARAPWNLSRIKIGSSGMRVEGFGLPAFLTVPGAGR